MWACRWGQVNTIVENFCTPRHQSKDIVCKIKQSIILQKYQKIVPQ